MEEDGNPLFFEQRAWNAGRSFVAGIDEAGRGPLAGPVVAAACILPKNLFFKGLNDSKQLSEKKRLMLFEQMHSCDSDGFFFSISEVSAEEIDCINIYQATMLAMQKAVEGLKKKPDFLLIDAMPLKSDIETLPLIKGDCRSHAIAAASVLAKVQRDILMKSYDKKWPEYGFARHKGYGTAEHRKAIEAFGPCPIHRKTFSPIKEFALKTHA